MFGSSVIQAIVGTSRPEAARQFYSETLGLKLISDDQYALLFAAGVGFIRVAKVAMAPSPHAQMVFQVDDCVAAVDALIAKGVTMERYAFLPQDDKGVWSAPDGSKVAWFRDPDLNLLSVTQAA